MRILTRRSRVGSFGMDRPRFSQFENSLFSLFCFVLTGLLIERSRTEFLFSGGW